MLEPVVLQTVIWEDGRYQPVRLTLPGDFCRADLEYVQANLELMAAAAANEPAPRVLRRVPRCPFVPH